MYIEGYVRFSFNLRSKSRFYSCMSKGHTFYARKRDTVLPLSVHTDEKLGG